jgi:hypothetical protein
VRDRASILKDVCHALSVGSTDAAASVLRDLYPFASIQPALRRYTPSQCIQIFVRDGFLDRYSGTRLVFPGALRLIAKRLPIEFPFHRNWRMDACHRAFYELFPTVDHIIPIARGGPHNPHNLITTSMLRNSAKANFLIDELGWSLLPSGKVSDWDGLGGWFMNQMRRDETLLADGYLKTWYRAAQDAVKSDVFSPSSTGQ